MSCLNQNSWKPYRLYCKKDSYIHSWDITFTWPGCFESRVQFFQHEETIVLSACLLESLHSNNGAKQQNCRLSVGPTYTGLLEWTLLKAVSKAAYLSLFTILHPSAWRRPHWSPQLLTKSIAQIPKETNRTETVHHSSPSYNPRSLGKSRWCDSK